MISRWLFYIRLGWLDLVRLWPTTQHHVIIVAGICLPILILLGLKRGHVAELREELVTSPSGREVTFWSAQKGELMDRNAVAKLERELPAVEVIIPEKQRIVRLRRQLSGKNTIEVESATLFSTRQGDPKLKQLGVKAPRAGERVLILGQGLAEQLNIKVNESLQVVVMRGRGPDEESAIVDCRIQAIIPTETQGAMIGYADIDLLDALEQYVRGQRVSEFGWHSARQPARDGYSSYLIFCEADSNLTADDQRLFAERGLHLVDLSDKPPDPLPELLAPEKRERLKIYQASTLSSMKKAGASLHLAPSELSELTTSDDVVVPWNSPASARIRQESWLLVGLSLPKRTWLREYFRLPSLAFDYEAAPNLLRPVNFKADSQTNSLISWPLNDKQLVMLKPEAVSDRPMNEKLPAKVNRHIAAVPANLTSWLTAHRAGLVEFDSSVQLFVPLPQPPVYDRARLYSTTIDDVPAVVKVLSEKQFAVMSETGRISEIHRQDVSLQLLVVVVGAGVFLFGVVTVVSVLIDSTDRKRATIGILRVMGMSRAGIFISILMRAATIGFLAAALSVGCGWCLASGLEWIPPAKYWWLNWKPVMNVELYPIDWTIVAVGSLLCCSFGALIPAWRASRLDPFDAIIEGRFR